jgi:hypothetical protein
MDKAHCFIDNIPDSVERTHGIDKHSIGSDGNYDNDNDQNIYGPAQAMLMG